MRTAYVLLVYFTQLVEQSHGKQTSNWNETLFALKVVTWFLGFNNESSSLKMYLLC
jgi:hypothetical protein